jgi:hypothetical protein
VAKWLLLAVGLLTVGFGVVDSVAGRRHSHRVVVKHYERSIVLPPANDPATVGVESAAVACPRGYRATGGGYSVEGLAVTVVADLFPRSYGAIAANQGNDSKRYTVSVGCVRGKTRARRASSQRRLERALREVRRDRRDR